MDKDIWRGAQVLTALYFEFTSPPFNHCFCNKPRYFGIFPK